MSNKKLIYLYFCDIIVKLKLHLMMCINIYNLYKVKKMRLFEVLQENDYKTAVFCFGRLNPPTIGHEFLIKEGQTLAEKVGGRFIVFPTHSHTPKKKALENQNPLPFDRKVYYLKEFFPGVDFITEESTRTLFGALVWLKEQGYNSAYMVTGSDRAQEFKDKISPYIPVLNPSVDPDKVVDLSLFEVHSVGGRDPKLSGIAGASGTKARQYAYEGKLDEFIAIIPGKNKRPKINLFKELRNTFGE